MFSLWEHEENDAGFAWFLTNRAEIIHR